MEEIVDWKDIFVYITVKTVLQLTSAQATLKSMYAQFSISLPTATWVYTINAPKYTVH